MASVMPFLICYLKANDFGQGLLKKQLRGHCPRIHFLIVSICLDSKNSGGVK